MTLPRSMDAAALIARTTVLEEYVIEAKRQDKRKASQSEGGIVAVGCGGGAVEKNSAALMPLLGAATGATAGATVAAASVAAAAPGDAAVVPLDGDFAGAGAPGALRQFAAGHSDRPPHLPLVCGWSLGHTPSSRVPFVSRSCAKTVCGWSLVRDPPPLSRSVCQDSMWLVTRA